MLEKKISNNDDGWLETTIYIFRSICQFVYIPEPGNSYSCCSLNRKQTNWLLKFYSANCTCTILSVEFNFNWKFEASLSCLTAPRMYVVSRLRLYAYDTYMSAILTLYCHYQLNSMAKEKSTELFFPFFFLLVNVHFIFSSSVLSIGLIWKIQCHIFLCWKILYHVIVGVLHRFSHTLSRYRQCLVQHCEVFGIGCLFFKRRESQHKSMHWICMKLCVFWHQFKIWFRTGRYIHTKMIKCTPNPREGEKVCLAKLPYSMKMPSPTGIAL